MLAPRAPVRLCAFPICPAATCCSSQLADFKEESERKFALQIAENKRLSVQMSSQKKENQRLIERIHELEERVKRLELDIGNDL